MAFARKEIIRPAYEPVVVTLDRGAHGCIQTEGKFGVDYKYVVNGGQATMYVPQPARDAIARTNAAPGESVEIVKTQTRQGATVYVVNKISDATEPARPTPTPAPRPERPESVQPQPVRRDTAVKPDMPAPGGALARFMCIALHDLMAVTAYAKQQKFDAELGLDTPSWDDVRSIAATYFIQDARAKERL